MKMSDSVVKRTYVARNKRDSVVVISPRNVKCYLKTFQMVKNDQFHRKLVRSENVLNDQSRYNRIKLNCSIETKIKDLAKAADCIHSTL